MSYEDDLRTIRNEDASRVARLQSFMPVVIPIPLDNYSDAKIWLMKRFGTPLTFRRTFEMKEFELRFGQYQWSHYRDRVDPNGRIFLRHADATAVEFKLLFGG